MELVNSRLIYNINVRRREGKSGESLVMRLESGEPAASSGSACSSGKQEPSAVLLALAKAAVQSLIPVAYSGKFTMDDIHSSTESEFYNLA